MARPKKPPPDNRVRLHYINEWAERRDMNQAEIAESLGVNPSTVTRWFQGGLPSEEHLPRVAAMFGVEIDELFRSPDDNWLKRFFEERDAADKKRILDMLKIMFPDKIA